MPAPSFLIKNGGTDFMNRQKGIFDLLSAVENESSLSRTSNDDLMEIDDSQPRGNKRKRTKRFLGKESIFKAPMEPPPSFKRPKHIHIHGQRWIKYSLADVSDYDLSNEGNTAAALSFLKTLKERKAEDAKEEIDAGQKHVFTSRAKNQESPRTTASTSNTNNVEKSDNESEMSKAVFKSTKLIMPEYVVGQSKTVKKKIKKIHPSGDNIKEVYLDHIHADDDIDDE